MEIDEALESIIAKFLMPYLETLHYHYIDRTENAIEVHGQIDNNDLTRFLLLRVVIDYHSKELLISNIFVPMEHRRRGIGFRLLDLIYNVGKLFSFKVLLVDLVDSFREKMLKRGAKPGTDNNSLVIVDETNLL